MLSPFRSDGASPTESYSEFSNGFYNASVSSPDLDPEPVIQADDMILELSPQEGAIKKSALPWEDGILPLVFDDNISNDQKEKLFEACAEWSAVANVKCIEGKYKKRKLRVSRHKNLGCFCIWGMGSSYVVLKRWMNLAPDCWKHSTLLHELGHAFGLIHEHQRSDRDQFIQINDKNVKASFLGLLKHANFKTQKSSYSTAYDFESIMHYSRKSFSKNGKNTIEPLPQYIEWLDVIGKVPHISALDAETLAQQYGPPQLHAIK
mgnify:CR=1 FL=1